MLSLSAFVELLQESRLLETGQLAEVRDTLQRRFPDAKALARELVQRNWLTAYQANQLLVGRGQELVLGHYVLLERLGEGGMGQVFTARHQKLGRIVALKVIRKERLDHPEIVRRFRREIQAAAQLDHPNIIHAFDADEAEGTHFFVMEYVEGIDLARLVKQRGPLPVREACDYIRQAALGLQHAHERGLVHRDIKPSNLLLSLVRGPWSVGRDRAPESHGRRTTDHGQIKLLDMGLARVHSPVSAAESTSSLTQQGTIMGTPDYIAPEQAMSSHTVDIRADLYSLGCTLYFLLTGKVPFSGGTLMDKLVKHQTEEALPLEQRRPDVPPGVVAIVQKLMAKRPADRYQMPAELALALAPFAGVEAPMPAVAVKTPVPRAAEPMVPATPTPTPVAALRDTASELQTTVPPLPQVAAAGSQSERWSWPLLLGVGSVFLIGVLALSIALISGRRDREKVTGPSTDDRPKTPVVTVEVHAHQRWQDTGIDMQVNMPIILRAKGAWKMAPGAKECSADGAADAAIDRNVLPEARPMCLIGRIGNADTTYALGKEWTFYPRTTGRLFVQANDLDPDDNSGTLTLEIQTDQKGPAATPPPPTTIQVADVALRKLAERATNVKGETESMRQELFAFRTQYAATPQAARAVELLMKLPSPLDRLDGTKIAKDARVAWNTAGWTPQNELVAVLGQHHGRHWGSVTAIASSPDAEWVATGGDDKVIRVWDTARMQEQVVLRGHTASISCLACAPDGKTLASAAHDDSVRFWSTQTWQALQVQVRGRSVAFSPDGTKVVTGGGDGNARLWDAATGQLLHTLTGLPHNGGPVCFSPDGKLVACADANDAGKTVMVWDLASREVKANLKADPGMSGAVAMSFALDGQSVAVLSNNQSLRLWDLGSGKQRDPVQGVQCLAPRSDGRLIQLRNRDGGVELADLASAEQLQRLQGAPGSIRVIGFSGDGRRMVSGGWDHTVRLWDCETGKELRPLETNLHAVAISPDNRTLATGCADGSVRLWDAVTGAARLTLGVHPALVVWVAFLPDHQTLVSGSSDGTTKLWDLHTAKERSSFKLPSGLHLAACAPDGKTLATWNADKRTVEFWDLATCKERARMDALAEGTALVYSPDGRMLAMGSYGGNALVWDTVSGQEHLSFRDERHIFALAFTPDSKTLISADYDSHVKVWDPATGRMRAAVRQHRGRAEALAMSLDGTTLASASRDGLVVLWSVSREGELAKAREWQLPGAVHSLAFATDGRHLATVNANGTVYVYRLPGHGTER